MTPLEVVNELLSNPVDIDNVRSLTTPDVNYVSLNKHHPDLTRVLPWAGDHRGPEEIVKAFQGINTMWETVAFDVKAAFSQGEDVAMFGEFSYRSKDVGKTVTSPFGIHLKVVDGKVAYILFLEDTLLTSSSVQTGGEAIYKSLGSEVTLTA
jgi:ketosteroid isomerase-like protein